ncbi:MAG TPA: hypothetical protein VKZ77_15475 [Bacillaceae bacterium]|nr:hypothetical protein [Bacillaceae bacterium]
MSKADLKKYIKRVIFLAIGVYIIYSIYIHLEYRHYIKQSIDRNYDSLDFISVKGNNLANRLEEFIQLPVEKEEFSDVKSEFDKNWRIVNGESKNIHSYLFTIRTKYMGDAASDWDLLQFSLLRVDEFINGMTNKFLENHSYSISDEEKEKMEAVIEVFRIISEEKDNEFVNIEDILKSIKEPMLIINENYSDVLERLGR